MLHSAHAHWTKGNLFRSTGEIDPEPEFSLLQTTQKFSSRLKTGAKARTISQTLEYLYPQSKAPVLIGFCDWLVR